MKIILLLYLLLFSFISKAQNNLFSETERNINIALLQQKNIYFDDDLGNRKPLVKIQAFPSGILVLVDKLDSINENNSFSVDLLKITKFEILKKTILFTNTQEIVELTMVGLNKETARRLKNQFKKLQALAFLYQEKKKKDEIEVRKQLKKEQYDLPETKQNSKRIKAEKAAINTLENKK